MKRAIASILKVTENDNQHSSYTLEYIEEQDVDMDLQSHSEEELEEGEIDFMVEEVAWRTPHAMNIIWDYPCNDMTEVLFTNAVMMEDERIKSKDEVRGSQCIELESSQTVSSKMNAKETTIRTDYP